MDILKMLQFLVLEAILDAKYNAILNAIMASKLAQSFAFFIAST